MYNRIKELREDKDLYQKDLAEILNITQRNYSYIETGVTDVPTNILIALSKFYNTSIDYILGETDVIARYPRSNNLS